MRAYSLERLSDRDLLCKLKDLVAQDRATTAELIAHIAETDARRLYAPAGYPSMFEYCVRELRLSEQAALKRIRAGRAARRFPAVLAALVDGRLHLTAVVLLHRHLNKDNVDELVAAATHKTQAEVQLLIAQRFPQKDLPTRIRPLPAAAPLSSWQADSTEVEAAGTTQASEKLAALHESEPGEGALQLSARTVEPASEVSARTVEPTAPEVSARTVGPPFPKVKPLAPERFAIQVAVSKSTHDKLRHAQELLSHSIPSGDLAAVLDRALDALVEKLEKRKIATTEHPRIGGRQAEGKRTIPAQVRRSVWERDAARCTFVNDSGHRCTARKFLEFDHVDPVSRGGHATLEGIRLRCRTHNQYEAEQVFGEGFMAQKRGQAREG